MPALFNSLGISFQYPDNWTLDDADARLGRKSVTVYSPGGAFWSISIHPANANLEKLNDTILKTIRQEYDSLEVEEAGEEIAGFSLDGFDLAFYCLDLTNTAHIRTVQTDQDTYTIYCQAEDREYDQVKRVFEAMTTSFLLSQKGLRDSR